jgi:hypothetical protein
MTGRSNRRFADELHDGKGIRWLFKQPENRRPGLD